ncbi:MAG: hypothetical protein ACM35G_12975 [Planctomycetaceae bacterium]
MGSDHPLIRRVGIVRTLTPPFSGKATRCGDEPRSERRLDGLTWAFVGLGVLLRLVRYLLRHPLWGDEAFLAINLLTRDYINLLRPLDYGQVSPLLFLWIERALIDWLGFSEFSLRLFPTACSVASVLLFRLVAGRVVRGAPLLLAVAIFSVSFYPIRHGGEVKAYASDLLVGMLLPAPAIEWWRSRDDRWLWGLAAIVPLALALSHPAVFVAGGISLGLSVAVWRSGRRGTRAAYAALNGGLIAAYAALFISFTGPQGASIARDAPAMLSYWASGFPPLGSAWELMRWLIQTHTSHMFAYPTGGARGASALTSLAVAAGVVDLARRRQATLLAICLTPFGLALVASAVRCYPYGGSTRTMLYLAPAVCLLAGLGAASLLARLRRPQTYRRFLSATVASLAGFGLISLGLDIAHPYKTVYDLRARDFARRFWTAQAHGAELACLRHDLGIAFKPSHWQLLRTPLYLCNQAIYSRRRWVSGGPRWDAVSAARPLRCVLFDEHPLGKSSPAAWDELPRRDPALAGWLTSMRSRYTLRSSKTYVVNEGVCRNGIWFEDRYVVLEFTPTADRSIPTLAEKSTREPIWR